MDTDTGHNAAQQGIRRLAARLRFRHLELLSLLHQGASLRVAAQALHQTPPALSKSLREVEVAAGFALCVRSARGLDPTPRGERALCGATHVAARTGPSAGRGGAESVLTSLRIGVPPFAAQGTLPGISLRLFSRHSHPRVQVPQEPAPPLVQALRAGALDALISRYPARWPQTPGQPLRYEKRLDAGFAVIAPAGHALARARCVDWQRLAQAPWIMPAASAMLRRLIDDAFRREGLPAPIIGSNCPSTNIHLVAAGLGLSAVPQVLMRAALAAGQMARVRAAPGIRPGPVVLICREAAEQPARGHVA